MVLPVGIFLVAAVVLYAGFNDIPVADAIGLLLGRTPTKHLGTLSGLDTSAASSTGTGTPGATTGTGGTPGTGNILSMLFPAGMHVTKSRADQGRDLEGQAGAPVFAPGSGHLIRNGSDPSGFGNSYPIVHFDTGPWAGLDIYFGHIQSALSGGSFSAGAVIGHLQNGSGPFVGNAAGIPGHIEIGLAPGGSPGSFGQSLPPGL